MNREKYDGKAYRRMQVQVKMVRDRQTERMTAKERRQKCSTDTEKKGGYDRGHLSLGRGMIDISVDCEL